MGRPPKHRAIVRMDELQTTAGGIILPLSDLKSNTGLVVQSAIDNVPQGRKVALNDEFIEEVILPEGKFASIHERQILMIK